MFREVDQVRIGGRGPPARIYELVGRREALAEATAALMDRYAEALAHYRARRFAEAAELFDRCANDFDDTLSRLYAARARHHLQTPPPEGWEGNLGRPEGPSASAAVVS